MKLPPREPVPNQPVAPADLEFQPGEIPRGLADIGYGQTVDDPDLPMVNSLADTLIPVASGPVKTTPTDTPLPADAIKARHTTATFALPDGPVNSKKPPLPDFCHKCGRCCTSATTYAAYPELLTRAEEGDPEAVHFLSIFEPYASLDEARAAVPDQVDQVISELLLSKAVSLDQITFYRCRYVTDEGLCGIYERRPRCCVEAPGHGWSLMPPGCGFEGWQFRERERQKRMVRNMKTNLYILEQLSEDGHKHPTRDDITLDEIRAQIDAKIAVWKPYGADYW